MFSLIASVLFRPSAAVSKSVNAVKASVTDFDPRKVVGMIFSCACVRMRACVPVRVQPLVSIFVCLLIQLVSDFKVSGLQLRRQMRPERDRAGLGTSDSHGSFFFVFLLCGIDNLTHNHQWHGFWLPQVCVFAFLLAFIIFQLISCSQ